MTEQEIIALINTNNQYLNYLASNLASPKVYATLSALQTAYPSGDSRIYVIPSTGFWYYWSGTAWVSGGYFQSTGLADNSVTTLKIADASVTTAKVVDYAITAAKMDHTYAMKLLGASGTSTGTSSALALTTADYFALNTLTLIRFISSVDIAAGATLNINATGAFPLYTLDGVQIKANCIKTGAVVEVFFNATLGRWYLQYVSITVDTELSALSFNAINNNAVTTGLFYKANTTDVNAALALKANITDVNTSLALKSNIVETDFNATNLISNGDFSNGTTGWSPHNSTISASNNILTNIGDGTINIPYESFLATTMVMGYKYYIRMKMRVTNNECLFFRFRIFSVDNADTIINMPIQNQWYIVERVVTATVANSLNLYVTHGYTDAAIANGKVLEVQYVSAIDLTATFGAGNEPTATEMDEILAYYPNSWFDGTVNLCDNRKFAPYLVKRLSDIEALKANIAQEAWITPTLLNGWTGTLQYYKDTIGIVHFKGYLTGGTSGTAALTLPLGYKLLATSGYFPLSGNQYGNLYTTMYISSGVNIVPIGAVTYWHFNSVTFRAEA